METPLDQLKGKFNKWNSLTDITHILRFVVPYLSIRDLIRLGGTCKKMEPFVEEGDFCRLEIHTVDSTDFFDDVLLSESIMESASLLMRYQKNCQSIIILNQDELEDVKDKILKNIKMTLLKICKYNFNLGAWTSDRLITLSLGFDSVYCIGSSAELRLATLQFPNLKTLDLTAFPVSKDVIFDSGEISSFGDCSPFVLWLMTLLESIRQLQWFRLNCSVYEPKESSLDKEMLYGEICEKKWNSNSIFFLEIYFNQPIVFDSVFTDHILLCACEGSFPSLHTLTLSSRVSETLLEKISECKTIFHLVLNNFNLSSSAWLKFGTLLKNNCQTLQVLVLKIIGKSEFHFDSFLHLILFHKVLQLDRFEICVVVNPETSIMVVPYQTMTASVSFRCNFKCNTFFKRSIYGLAMAERRQTGPVSTAASPMKLFATEMVRDMLECSAEQWEANMCTEWNALSKQQRASYVEIFDEFVDVEIRQEPQISRDDHSGKTEAGYCDLAATMAVLRE